MEKIRRKKEEKSVYIIAHYYQRDEVQDIADFVGDSYAMAVAAKKSPCNTILVAGVDFMAQSAAILCPDKTVLSPEPRATCPMANSIAVKHVLEYKAKHPKALIVSYVNTPAEIKAVSDVCCTSSNAGKIIGKLPPDAEIYFIPDQNLAHYVSSNLKRPLDSYRSCCPTHAHIKKEDVLERKKKYPGAPVLVHPECSPDVVALADYVGSTAGILNFVRNSSLNTFIIGTESGIMHSIRQAKPDSELIPACDELLCPNMKSINLEKILYSLEKGVTRITVQEDIREKAALALEKMIEYASS